MYESLNNVALGYRAGYASANGSGNNILIGYQAADNLTTGNNNIVIGYNIDNVTATADNRLNIGNLIFGTGLDGTGTTLASGNVGIGTSTPNAKLHVFDSVGGQDIAIFRDEVNASTLTIKSIGDDSPFIKGGSSGDGLYFGAGGSDTPLMVIADGGNVGIGTTTPAANLQVVSTSAGAETTPFILNNISSTAGTAIRTIWGATTNVGFNGNGRFDQLAVRQSDGSMDYSLISSPGGGGAPVTRFTLDASSGNIGIGTTTPAQKLQVFGNIRVGTSGSNGCLENFGGGVIGGTCSSDAGLKTNVEPLAQEGRSYIESLAALTPVTYNWNEEAAHRYSKDKTMENIGLIAQDVESQFPELVSRNEDGFRQVDFTGLQFYVIQAIKELWAMVQGHDDRINQLEQENQYLKDRIENIEGRLNIEAPAQPATIIESTTPTSTEEVGTGVTEEVAPETPATTEPEPSFTLVPGPSE